MKEAIKDLTRRKNDALELAKKLDQAIETMQFICEHKWRQDGHSHNDDYYVCTECGKEKWE